LEQTRLEDLLYQCYVNYYGFLIRKGGLPEDNLRLAVFCRYTAAHRKHPMSGGVDPVRIDAVSDYLALRRERFDIELAPLPDSLQLTAHDEALNRSADWRAQRMELRPQP
jgi:hypothetical protein